MNLLVSEHEYEHEVNCVWTMTVMTCFILNVILPNKYQPFVYSKCELFKVFLMKFVVKALMSGIKYLINHTIKAQSDQSKVSLYD